MVDAIYTLDVIRTETGEHFIVNQLIDEDIEDAIVRTFREIGEERAKNYSTVLVKAENSFAAKEPDDMRNDLTRHGLMHGCPPISCESGAALFVPDASTLGHMWRTHLRWYDEVILNTTKCTYQEFVDIPPQRISVHRYGRAMSSELVERMIDYLLDYRRQQILHKERRE